MRAFILSFIALMSCQFAQAQFDYSRADAGMDSSFFVNDLLILPDTDLIFAANTKLTFAPFILFEIEAYKTSDLDGAWSRLTLPPNPPILFEYHYKDGRLFIVSPSQLFISDNYGGSWAAVDSNLISPSEFTGYKLFNYQDSLYIAMVDTNDSLVLWKSGDLGDSWEEILYTGFDSKLSGGVNAFLELNGDMYLGMTTPQGSSPAFVPRFYVSADGGRTWRKQGYFGNNDYYAINYQDPWGAIYEVVTTINPSSGHSETTFNFLSDTVSAWTELDLSGLEATFSPAGIAITEESVLIYGSTDNGNGPTQIHQRKNKPSSSEELTIGSTSVRFFPQPVSNIMFLQFDEFIEGSMTVRDVAAKKVYETQVRGQNVQVDLGMLEAGMYFCTIVVKGEEKTIRFLKY